MSEEISLSASDGFESDKSEAIELTTTVDNDDIPDIKFERKEFKSDLDITDKMSGEDVIERILAADDEQITPWEEIELPSRGMYYDWSSGIIKVRPWGAQIDKILATSRIIQSGQAVSMMINSSTKFPNGFDPDDLLVGDQIFLLYYLRGITHGNMYQFATKTPSGDIATFDFDMNDLGDTITMANERLGNEPFKIGLPIMSEQIGRDAYVQVRFLRVSDTRQINNKRDALNKAVAINRATVVTKNKNRNRKIRPTKDTSIPVDDVLTKNISHVIVDVMGVKDRHKIEQFVDKLHSSDLAIIREWLRDNSPGVQPQISLTDPETGQEFKVMLPLTETFFRPQET